MATKSTGPKGVTSEQQDAYERILKIFNDIEFGENEEDWKNGLMYYFANTMPQKDYAYLRKRLKDLRLKIEDEFMPGWKDHPNHDKDNQECA